MHHFDNAYPTLTATLVFQEMHPDLVKSIVRCPSTLRFYICISMVTLGIVDRSLGICHISCFLIHLYPYFSFDGNTIYNLPFMNDKICRNIFLYFSALKLHCNPYIQNTFDTVIFHRGRVHSWELSEYLIGDVEMPTECASTGFLGVLKYFICWGF